MVESSPVRAAARVANVVLVGAALACAAALSYVFYHYGWTHQRVFTSPLGPVLFYGVPGALTSLFLAALRLPSAPRVRAAFIVVSTSLSVYAVDAVLALTTVDPRVRLARSAGLSFDARSKLDVVRELERQGIAAAVDVYPRPLLRRRTDGTLGSIVMLHGIEALPLGGIADKATVLCNEGGEYVVYRSDRHGFHNPSSAWDGDVDVAVVGDSFAAGYCVAPDDGFVEEIRARHPGTLNVAKTGNGPLIELASLKEYVAPLRPRLVLWFYFEGNDLQDLAFERDSPLLRAYLHQDRIQNLVREQAAIDEALAAFAEDREREMTAAGRRDMLSSVIKLSHLRSRLRLDAGDYQQTPAEAGVVADEVLELLGDVLADASGRTADWGGQLYFVYLPSRERFEAVRTGPGAPGVSLPELDRQRHDVLAMARATASAVIDVTPVFEHHDDPLSLFPFRQGVHYNEEGNGLVAGTVLRALAPRPSF